MIQSLPDCDSPYARKRPSLLNAVVPRETVPSAERALGSMRTFGAAASLGSMEPL